MDACSFPTSSAEQKEMSMVQTPGRSVSSTEAGGTVSHRSTTAPFCSLSTTLSLMSASYFFLHFSLYPLHPVIYPKKVHLKITVTSRDPSLGTNVHLGIVQSYKPAPFWDQLT